MKLDLIAALFGPTQLGAAARRGEGRDGDRDRSGTGCAQRLTTRQSTGAPSG
jgi:hypothetical protein